MMFIGSKVERVIQVPGTANSESTQWMRDKHGTHVLVEWELWKRVIEEHPRMGESLVETVRRILAEIEGNDE